MKTALRFTGHDTFACRATWLNKGLNFLEEGNLTDMTKGDAVIHLGVGKNMLQAIRHWVRAFNLVDDGIVGQQVFAGEATRLAYGTDEGAEGRDAFLEKRDPDWSPFPYHF